MDVLVLLWSASVFAAVAFFAAGLATHASVLRRRSTPMSSADATAFDEVLSQRRQAQMRCVELEAALARTHENAQREDGRAATLAEKVGSLHAAAQLLVPATEVQELHTRLAETSRRTTSDLAAQHRQKDELARAVTNAEARAQSMERELHSTKQQLEGAKQQLEGAKQQLEGTKQQLEGATQQLVTLADELATERSARPKRVRPARTRPASTGVVAGIGNDTVESSLAARLGALADECGYEVVVLSDAQGLLLAGVGDEQVQGTIAALSSVARELTTRAAEFVELRPVLIEVTDDVGRTLRIRLFQWEQEPIALASFGMGHPEPTQEEETVITIFPTLMAAS
jgi:hypothetical protein